MVLRFIQPLKPILVDAAPDGDRWIHEIKQDGYRVQAHLERRRATIWSSGGLAWSDRYAPIAAAVAGPPAKSVIIEGEAIVQDAQGRSDMALMRKAVHRHPERIVLIVFDLLHLDGKDLRRLPLEERRELLRALIAGADPRRIGFSEAIAGNGPDVFRMAEQLELEGIVSKRLGSVYRSGRSTDWLKVKCFDVAAFDVIGVEKSSTGAPVALLAAGGATGPEYRGSAFVTLPADARELFWRYDEARSTPKAVITGIAGRRKGTTWLKPGRRASVKYLRGEGMLRHATGSRSIGRTNDGREIDARTLAGSQQGRRRPGA